MESNKILEDKVVLNNDIKMPLVGFGTYKIPNDQTGKEALLTAFKIGYRHLDTAKIYKNEEVVGAAVRESGLPRNEIFVTTKLWGNALTKEEYLAEIDLSLEKLGLEYVDCILIHWPWENRKEAWQALEEAYRLNKVRAIGVSNYEVHHLEEMEEYATIVPVANQVEFHPGLNQDELRQYHQEHDIKTIGWGTMKFYQELSQDFKALEEKYEKTTHQIFLRWALQHDSLVIPKSMHRDRILQNSEIGDFVISNEDMKMIDDLPQERFGPNPDTYPATVTRT